MPLNDNWTWAPSPSFITATSTSAMYPQYTYISGNSVTFQPFDVSFNPNPPLPPAPKSDLDWLREQNDAVCALAKL